MNIGLVNVVSHKDEDNIEKDLLLNFQSASFISILYYWTEHPELKVNQILPIYIKIISNGIVNFVKDNMQ